MKFRTALGEVIRETRTEKFMTLRTLSNKASLSLSYLSEIERGRKEGSSEILECLANGLGLPLSDLILMAGWKIKIANEGVAENLELDLALENA